MAKVTEKGWLAPSVLPASGVPTQSRAVTSYPTCNVRGGSWKLGTEMPGASCCPQPRL